MSQKELQRAAVIFILREGGPGVCQSRSTARSNASACQTTQSRYRQGGEAALAHARGRPSHRRLPQRVRDRILHLARTTYAGFNDHHLGEKLVEKESFSLGLETLRRLLRSAGIGSSTASESWLYFNVGVGRFLVASVNPAAAKTGLRLYQSAVPFRRSGPEVPRCGPSKAGSSASDSFRPWR